ncbi:putative carboxylesterase 15 [Lasiodiplodia theobromae]|uniref:Putative carboxylesterase 15 n=1 Tax=Lasiodiplodia theobromae TaxID=45133 RepID=A0A5N5D148_9PEZI|nr:putative carboxylesterase 15 [Lasiodiplodia theobromae]
MPLVTFPSTDAYFKGFRIFDVTYKVVDSHPIQTSVLVPKSACKGPRPIIVRFHGGGLVAGTRLHAPWFPSYLLTYATAHSAIIISPDYRLLPEAGGKDILSDISSLWSWLLTSLHAYVVLRDPLNTSCGVDLGKILVTGESAGGWLAIQSALMHPSRIKTILSIFPMADLGDDHFTRGGRRSDGEGRSTYSKSADQRSSQKSLPVRECAPAVGEPGGSRASKAGIMGLGFLLDPCIIDEHVAAARDSRNSNSRRAAVLSSVTPPARMELSLALFQHGRLGELLGDERELYPLEVLEDLRRRGAGGARLPPLCIIHGTDDTVVPVQGSKRLARSWEKTWQQQLAGGETRDRKCDDAVKLVLRPGEHGFEAKASAEKDGWLRDALGWVADRWLN